MTIFITLAILAVYLLCGCSEVTILSSVLAMTFWICCMCAWCCYDTMKDRVKRLEDKVAMIERIFERSNENGE